jgi:hypothetical protein
MDDDDKKMLAKVLLCGYGTRDARGLPITKYLEKKEEQQARAILAGILRGRAPLDGDLRDMLAGLFDPAPDAFVPYCDREVIFKRRRAGRYRNHQADTEIVMRVRKEITQGNTTASAIQLAADQFALDESTVKKLWGRSRKYLDAVFGPAIGRGGGL